MSKWIDADVVIREIAEKGYDKAQTNEAFEAVNDACDIISDAPSIDLVRCGECKWLRYCETEDLDMYLDCDKPDGGGIPKSEGWYCADGERKESE